MSICTAQLWSLTRFLFFFTIDGVTLYLFQGTPKFLRKGFSMPRHHTVMPKGNKKSLFVTLPGETKDTNGIPASHGVVLIIVELLLVVLPVGGQG